MRVTKNHAYIQSTSDFFQEIYVSILRSTIRIVGWDYEGEQKLNRDFRKYESPLTATEDDRIMETGNVF